MSSTHTQSFDQIEDFSKALQQVIPTNNLSRSTLAELIGETVAYHTGTNWEYNEEKRILHITNYQAGSTTTVDVIRSLQLDSMNAVLQVKEPVNPENTEDDESTVPELRGETREDAFSVSFA